MMARTVLIAVPDLVFRSRIREAAKRAGAEASVASTMAAALERSLDSKPDVVVIDLGDERLEPFDLVRKLKAEPTLAGSTVVGFFSHVRIDIRNAARDAGCDVIVPRSAIESALAGVISGDAERVGTDEP